MFRTLIYPSSGAYDYSVELPHWSIVLGSMCVGVSVWLGWRCIRFAGWNSNTHRTKNNTTNVVIQQNSRKLLMMDILMSETCWAHKKWNKNSKWHQVGLLFFNYHNDARSNKDRIHSRLMSVCYRRVLLALLPQHSNRVIIKIFYFIIWYTKRKTVS